MKKGFTLIELLVVISIIGILASLTFVSYSGAQKQTRDTQRRSDLAQYRNGLENFAANNNGKYPLWSNPQSMLGTTSNFCSQPSSNPFYPNYVSGCPADPTGGTTYIYYYRSNGTGNTGAASATKYVLWAKLEAGNYWWEICSDGRAGKLTSSPTGAGGTCDVTP